MDAATINPDQLDLILSAQVDEISLPARATNTFRDAGILYVGQLVQEINPYRYLNLHNFGLGSLRKTQDVLLRLGVGFGSPTNGWNTDRASMVRATRLNDLRAHLAFTLGFFERSYPSVEKELEAILSALFDGRNQEIAANYWGWTGEKPRTLESVGDEFGMTRERVRQIVQKGEDASRHMWLPTEHVRNLLTLLEREAPIALIDGQKLISVKAGPTPFTVESLLKAADVLNVPTRLEMVREGVDTFVDVQGRSPSIHEITMELRKTSSSSGCTSVDRMALRLTGRLQDAPLIRRTIGGLSEITWLDDEQTWACSKAVERNRLSNTVRKILTVADQLHLSEMRRAAQRSHRVLFVPPQPVLGRFIENVCGHKIIEGNVIRSEDFASFDMGENEGKLVACFRALGSPLTREKIEQYCIDVLNMNDNSFYVYLTYSPIISKISVGIYGLVGATIDVGTVEELANDRRNKNRSEFGWNDGGGLWFATRLSRVSIKMGMLYLSSFVQSLTQGTWSAELSDGTPSGDVDVTEQGVVGLKSTLELSGAEPEDVVCLTFDFAAKIINIQVGDDELFEARSTEILSQQLLSPNYVEDGLDH